MKHQVSIRLREMDRTFLRLHVHGCNRSWTGQRQPMALHMESILIMTISRQLKKQTCLQAYLFGAELPPTNQVPPPGTVTRHIPFLIL
ncbi:MAG: hypothetical protein AB7V25_09265 [Mangrovibacterium sp.]